MKESPSDLSEKALTFPLDPDKEEEMMNGEFFSAHQRQGDNVYADSQPYDAARNMYEKDTTGTQTFSTAAEYMRFMNRQDPLIREHE